MKQNCTTCQQPMLKDSPKGLCPTCLLNRAVGTPVESLYHYPITEKAQPLKQLSDAFSELEITELIGQGASGTVFKAYHSMGHESVALKVLSSKLSADVEFAERFVREGQTLATLNHPNIVKVLEAGERDGFHYILMEHIDGPDLKGLIRSKQLSLLDAQILIPQICEGVQYAHQQGVIHRDIKPENILVNEYGEVKIADFGLAKLTRTKELVSLTRTGQVMGTPHYMAPEQLENPMEVDHRADIYGVGVVIYELLTGELPIGRFPLPSEVEIATVQLDEVVLTLLEKKPEKRYQAISEVLHDIEKPLESLTHTVRYFKERKDSKTSRNAVMSAFSIPLSLAAPFGLNLILQHDDGNFFSVYKLLPFSLICIGLLSPILATFYGLRATHEILNNRGKTRGLYWSLAAVFGFPLIFADAVLINFAVPALGTGSSKAFLIVVLCTVILLFNGLALKFVVKKTRERSARWLNGVALLFCVLYTITLGLGGLRFVAHHAPLDTNERRLDKGLEKYSPYAKEELPSDLRRK